MSNLYPGSAAAAALALSFVVASGDDASAQTATGSLGVTVQVQDVCAVDGGTLDFGAYNGGQASAVDAVGSIRYLGCSAGDLVIALDGGNQGDVNGRQMTNGAGQALAYQLYRNDARSLVWGQAGDALSFRLLVSGSGEIPVYGRIPGGQSAQPGTYSDAINVTLTF